MIRSELWSQLHGGLAFNFSEPEKGDKVTDLAIAWSLCRLPRFLGHTTIRWTVAAHSMLVKDIGTSLLSSLNEQDLAAPYLLLHDAHEAIIGDIPKPFKTWLLEERSFDLRKVEKTLEKRIRKELGFDPSPPTWIEDLIGEADTYALKLERDTFMSSKHEWVVDDLIVPSVVTARPWTLGSTHAHTRQFCYHLGQARSLHHALKA